MIEASASSATEPWLHASDNFPKLDFHLHSRLPPMIKFQYDLKVTINNYGNDLKYRQYGLPFFEVGISLP